MSQVYRLRCKQREHNIYKQEENGRYPTSICHFLLTFLLKKMTDTSLFVFNTICRDCIFIGECVSHRPLSIALSLEIHSLSFQAIIDTCRAYIHQNDNLER